jgi:translocation and assembly module TamA
MLSVLSALGSQLSLADIQIPDVPDAVRNNIVPQLSLTDQPCSAIVDTPLMRQRTLKETEQALQALGYYQTPMDLIFSRRPDSRPSDSANANAPKAECWVAQIKLTLPPPVMLRQVKVDIVGEAQQLPAFNKMLADLPAGKPLNHRDYENLKRDLLAVALQYGYFDAQFDRAELQVDVQKREARIFLRLNPGVRYVFGEVKIEHNDPVPRKRLDDDFLQRYWSFETGDLYDQSLLERLNQDLFNTGYFQSVSVLRAIPNTPSSTISDAPNAPQAPIAIQLTPKPQHAYDLGAGAATDTGPRVSVGYQNRYLTSKGWKLSEQMTLSEVTSDIQAKLIMPLSQPARRQWEIYGGFQSKNTDTSEEDKLTVGTAHVTNTLSGWQRSIFVDLLRESYQVGEQGDQVFLLMPGVSWSKSQADDWVYPRHGWRVQTRLRVADQSLASDTDFGQVWASAKQIHSFGPLLGVGPLLGLNRARLLLRAEVGFTEYADFDALPSSIRFFAGGDSSVRGYDYQSLGPTDANGDVSGGPQLLVGSAELDYRLWRKWAAATFIDAGNAFYLDSTPSFADINFARGVGIGLRWLSPLGPIRFDVAKALDVNQSVRFHLSMGPDL